MAYFDDFSVAACVLENMAAVLPQDSHEGQSAERPESIIECIAIFYQKGKTKLDYVRKERYRARIPTGIKSLTKLKSIVRYVNFKFFYFTIKFEYINMHVFCGLCKKCTRTRECNRNIIIYKEFYYHRFLYRPLYIPRGSSIMLFGLCF